MKRRDLLSLLAAIPAAGFAPVGFTQGVKDLMSAVKDPLIGLLTSKLGVTDNQAKGGMGSMLTLAKEKMTPANFNQLASVIPTANGYMDSAKQLGAVGTSPLKDMSGLNAAFAKLGIKPEVAQQFVPLVTDYLGKIGGDSVKSLLASVFK